MRKTCIAIAAVLWAFAAVAGTPGLGISVEAEISGLLRPTLDALKVTEVKAGSPVARAGVRAGDVIVEINGKPTKGASASDMSRLLEGVQPGQVLRLKIARDQSLPMDLDVVVGS